MSSAAARPRIVAGDRTATVEIEAIWSCGAGLLKNIFSSFRVSSSAAAGPRVGAGDRTATVARVQHDGAQSGAYDERNAQPGGGGPQRAPRAARPGQHARHPHQDAAQAARGGGEFVPNVSFLSFFNYYYYFIIFVLQ